MSITPTLRTLLIAAIFCFITACGNNNKSSNTTGADSTTANAATPTASPNTATSTAKPVYKKPTPVENKFNDLRTNAIITSPNQLKIVLPADKDVVYGVVFDQEIDGATATLATYQTGDVSLYLSTGGGIIGGGAHQNVSSAGKKFVALAQTYLDKAQKAKTITVPDKGMVKFYLLTNKGIYVADESIKNLTAGSSPLLGLFTEANNVITQLRQAK